MKINTQINLKGLDGKEMKDGDNTFPIGQAIANILVASETGGKMKMFTLATKFYNDKQVDVDASDLSLVKEAVKATKIYNALVAGQCELLLEAVKEDK